MSIAERTAIAFALLAIGCGHAPVHAVVANAVTVRNSEGLNVTQEAIEELARQGDASSADVEQLGLVAQSEYSRDQLQGLAAELSTPDEFVWSDLRTGLLSLSNQGVAASDIIPVVQSALVSPSSARLLPSAEKALLEASVVELQAANDDAKRTTAVRALLVNLDSTERAVRRQIYLKRIVRDWIWQRLDKYVFKPSITLTIDMSDSQPLVYAERMYVALAGHHERVFIEKERNCNDDFTACRILFEYQLNPEDLTIVGESTKTKAADLDTTKDPFRTNLRDFLDRYDVDVKLFVNGEVVAMSMPGEFITIR